MDLSRYDRIRHLSNYCLASGGLCFARPFVCRGTFGQHSLAPSLDLFPPCCVSDFYRKTRDSMTFVKLQASHTTDIDKAKCKLNQQVATVMRFERVDVQPRRSVQTSERS